MAELVKRLKFFLFFSPYITVQN